MTSVAAIDIGSNALRLAVATLGSDGLPSEPEVVREPVRLGRDVFQQGALGPDTIERLVSALLRFRSRLDATPADHVRVVATSALREAKNRREVLARVREATGFDIDVIGGDEEARLVLRAVAQRFDLRGKTSLLVDLGGGSAEITVAVDGAAVASGTYEMGSVRMLEAFGAGAPRGLVRHVRGFLEPMGSLVLRELGAPHVDQGFGAGGNLDALGELARRLLGRPSADVVRRDDLRSLIDALVDLTYEERVQRLRLRPDRADVILPAAVVYHFVMELLRLRELTIPRVGLKDGVLLELAEQASGLALGLPEAEVLATARRLGARYAFDEPHAEAVARLAAQLFDATRPLHGLGREDRLLLQTAALLHDIGRFVNLVDHHKHSHYLIEASPIFGLSPLQKRIVAVVARYHRKTLPRFRHEAFLALGEVDRARVRKLAALLGLANGLDAEHGACVEALGMTLAGGRLRLSLQGRGDLLLERWAVARHATLFEDVYQTKVVIDEPTNDDATDAGAGTDR
jgi:exopolyphosphatase/guanosine-5'-triphosphate,3'-diphosphate pyrophosphatase